MTDTPKFGNNSDNSLIQIGTIPLAANTYTLTSASVATSSILTFTITSTTARKFLSIWNFLISLHVDTDDAAHQWPLGASLSGAQLSLRMAHWIDYNDSNDTLNTRKVRVAIENFSGGTRTYYLHYKAYTFANVTGSSA